MKQKTLILTLSIDQQHQDYFDKLRAAHFPAERNYISAHLILFHNLPDKPDTIDCIQKLNLKNFELIVSGIMFLGFGVAFRIESPVLQNLKKKLSIELSEYLIPQDRQPYRPHITIQNKVRPETARALEAELERNFEPFTITATGLELHTYLDGPWQHHSYYPFT